MLSEITPSTSPTDEDKERPFSLAEIVKFLVVILVYPVLMGPVLLIGAFIRTAPQLPPLWFGFWMTEITLPVSYLLTLLMLWDCPRVMRERMSKKMPDKSDSEQEKRFYKITTFFFFLGLVLMTWDGVGRRESFPKMMNILGSFALLVSFIFTSVVFRSNKYASRIVYVQEGHELIVTGPYSIVRHPMYLGTIPMLLGMPLCAGSYWGLIPMSLVLIYTGYRIFDEERFLIETFGSKYEDYQEKVKYKMVPYIF